MRSSYRAVLTSLLLAVPACDRAPIGLDGGAPALDTGLAVDAAARSCFTDEDCNDGYYCNGSETCHEGHCLRVALVCDDGIACTRDVCSETTHACVSRAEDADGDGFGDATCHDAM